MLNLHTFPGYGQHLPYAEVSSPQAWEQKTEEAEEKT